MNLPRKLTAAPWVGTYNPNTSDIDIFNCFRLLLGRLPSEQEWPGHSLAAGQDLATVVAGYLNSLEFANRNLLRREHGDFEVCRLESFSMYLSRQDLAVGNCIAVTGAYEPHVAREIKARLRPGSVFVDIGANIGYFSLLAAPIVEPHGKVIAVEPNIRNAQTLHASRELNGFANLTILQAAAGPTWDMLSLNSVYSNGVVSPVASDISDLVGRDTVLSLPLDAVLGDARIDLIKIDVEGFEFQALSGFIRSIDRNLPAVISEFTPNALPDISGVMPIEYLSFFTQRGYRLAVIGQESVQHCASAEDVLKLYEASRLDHIDILAEYPYQS